jgi:hypothetical protein
LIPGWSLSVPTAVNQVKTTTFEEAVLLLTEKALYFCRLDWGTEKVREFERIGLENVQGIMRGTYITSTLAQRHMDADKNVGFVVRYRTEGGGDLVRRNTRALDSGAANDEQRKQDDKSAKPDATRFLAFKALPPSSTTTSPSSSTDTELEVVKSVTDEISRVANKAKGTWDVKGTAQDGLEYDGKGKLEVEEKDIISLADARKSTGYLEQLTYQLKKSVWG